MNSQGNILQRRFARLIVPTLVAMVWTGLYPISLRAEDAGITAELQELRNQVQTLMQEVRILKRQHEIEEEQALERGSQQTRVSAGSTSINFKSSNARYDLKLGGWFQADSRWFLNTVNTTNGAPSPRGDTFLIRRARLLVEGRFFDAFTYNFQPEFAGTTFSLLDANVNYEALPGFQIRMGRFKVPIGLELLQTDNQGMAMERSFVTGLVPSRDTGFTVHGDLWDARLQYDVGVFNGSIDGANGGSVDFDGAKDVVARIFAQPFRPSSKVWLQGLGFGVAGSWGRHEGISGRPASLLSGGSQSIWGIRTDKAAVVPVEADGAQWRIVPQISYYNGPLSILGEYVVNNAGYRGGVDRLLSQHTRVEHAAWHADVGWVLTGENATPKGIAPRHNFNPTDGQWGALQLFARYSELHLDPRSFPTLADPAYSVRYAVGYSAGLNWYLNPNVRVNLHYALTQFHGGDFNGKDRPDEHAVLTRLQLVF